MPVVSQDELEAIIDANELCAFSLDTNVFHRYGYNLTTANLLAVGQLPARGVEFVVSEVVANEVLGHIVENEERVSADLRDALRRYSKARRHLKSEVEQVAPLLDLDRDLRADADKRWAEFLQATKGSVLRAGDHVDASELAAMYFGVRAPFEPNEDKKAEFPDAMALLELEGHGEAKGAYVLAVSRDGGWASFAATAKRVIVVQELPAAIAMFHTADRAIAERAVALLADDASAVRDDVDAALSRFVDDLYPEVEGSSFLEFSAEFSSAELTDILPVNPEGVAVIEAEAENVTLSFEIGVVVRVEADFSFYVHDSVDDDYMGMGTLSAHRDISLTVPVVMKVPRGVTEQDGAIDVRIERVRPLTVDFGDIEPSGWRDDY